VILLLSVFKRGALSIEPLNAATAFLKTKNLLHPARHSVESLVLGIEACAADDEIPDINVQRMVAVMLIEGKVAKPARIEDSQRPGGLVNSLPY